MRGRWPSLSTSPPHPSCSSSSSCCYHRSSRPPATAASTAPGPPTTPPRSPSPVRAFPSTAADRPTSPCFFASSYGSVALILTGVRLRRRFMRVRRRGGVHGRRLPRRRGPRAVPGRRRLRRLLPGNQLLGIHGRERVAAKKPVIRSRRAFCAGPVQGQEALRRGGRPGGRHGPRQDQPLRPRAQQPGLRRHGAPHPFLYKLNLISI